MVQNLENISICWFFVVETRNIIDNIHYFCNIECVIMRFNEVIVFCTFALLDAVAITCADGDH